MEAVATPLAGKPLFSNKALKKLIFPLVIEQFLAISVGFCDTVMISEQSRDAQIKLREWWNWQTR